MKFDGTGDAKTIIISMTFRSVYFSVDLFLLAGPIYLFAIQLFVYPGKTALAQILFFFILFFVS